MSKKTIDDLALIWENPIFTSADIRDISISPLKSPGKKINSPSNIKLMNHSASPIKEEQTYILANVFFYNEPTLKL